MTRRSGRSIQMVCAGTCLVIATTLTPAQQRFGAEERAAALRTFNTRIESYVSLRDRLAGPLPSFEASRNTWSGLLARQYLASAIRAARGKARQGDVFVPPVDRLFRELIAQSLARRDEEGLVDGFDPDSIGGAAPAINEPLASQEGRELPPIVGMALPPLPEDIAYRLVGTHLILWDVHAEVVVDVLPEAIALSFES